MKPLHNYTEQRISVQLIYIVFNTDNSNTSSKWTDYSVMKANVLK